MERCVWIIYMYWFSRVHKVVTVYLLPPRTDTTTSPFSSSHAINRPGMTEQSLFSCFAGLAQAVTLRWSATHGLQRIFISSPVEVQYECLVLGALVPQWETRF